MINGSRNLKGWGQGQQNIDQTLLYVRGFDPNTKTFKYEVNQRFGSPRQTLIRMREPMRITAMFKVDLGPVRERQTLERNLGAGRTREGEKYPEATIKSTGVSSIPNAITTVLRSAETLKLTPLQADSIARLNRRYTIRLDSIWGVAAKQLAELPRDFEMSDAWARYLEARRAALDIMVVVAPAIRDLLTSKQLRKLSIGTLNSLDVRFLNAVRSGTGAYAGTSLGPGGQN